MPLAAGSPEAAAVVWNPLGEPGQDPAQLARAARLRGLVQTAVAALAAGLIWALWSQTVATVVITIAGLLLATSQISPLSAYAAVERGFAALGHWTGEAISTIALSLLFFLVFLPFGLLFRRGRRDSMKRFYESERDSYWERRETARAASDSRKRQY